ncbi:PTS sugar transporter subunit IIA [Atopococcus tabaci]|uniref:PTS sugar transporter subunit IIA n=1 Tax=Atopococcus tabaci TaxID=269774 RepID=UPI00042A03B4|nr:PTS sugar transporter subunit IIA [Atopococcus tabaci]
MLNELLNRDRMQHQKGVESWQEAIRVASGPLLKEHVIDEMYVDAMIQSVEDNGPYIVLKDYFALPHAAAGKGVYVPGMALLTLEDPVDLKGNPVKIFLVLAAIDSSTHLEALSQLSEQLMDDEVYEVFLSGDLDAIGNALKL